ncbi:MAG TPA: WbqC family protein [Burkholderiales bacterium]|nr:WbqC family protein [Burkholderiales bacterium]
MLVAIHQPHYLPWLGYLEKMAQADLFIVLDHVQFERGNYQNRTQVRVNGAAHWLTVPVVQRSQKERIDEKLIDTRQDWEATHYETLRRAYGQAAVAPLRPIYEMPWERLVDLNDAMLRFLRAALGIHTPLIYSSALDVTGAKSELVLNLCLAVGADALLVGLGGSRNYLDRAAFAAAGVELAFQEFKHPVYPQRGPAPFIQGLSAVDFLFNKKISSREELTFAAA